MPEIEMKNVVPDSDLVEAASSVHDDEASDRVANLAESTAGERIEQIPIHVIWSDANFNCRGELTPLDYLSLAADMSQRGQLQPIILQKWSEKEGCDFRVVVGHCRLAAAKHLKWPTVGAVIREFKDDAAAYANIAENLKRRQLNIAQEAKAVTFMLSRGITRKQLQESLDQSAAWVNSRADFSKLPLDIQAEAISNTISTKDLNNILKIPGVAAKYTAVREIKEAREKAERNIEEMESIRSAPKSPAIALAIKRPRKGPEIEALKRLIYDTFGHGVATRALAWAQGYISYSEMFDTMVEAAEYECIPFERPASELAPITIH